MYMYLIKQSFLYKLSIYVYIDSKQNKDRYEHALNNEDKPSKIFSI